MTITGYEEKTFVNAKRESVKISNMNDLYKLGSSYGVHKLMSDPPHWSDDGK